MTHKDPCTLKQKSKLAWLDADWGQARALGHGLPPLTWWLVGSDLWAGFPSPPSEQTLWESVCSLRNRSSFRKLEGRGAEFFFLTFLFCFALSPPIFLFACCLWGPAFNGQWCYLVLIPFRTGSPLSKWWRASLNSSQSLTSGKKTVCCPFPSLNPCQHYTGGKVQIGQATMIPATKTVPTSTILN